MQETVSINQIAHEAAQWFETKHRADGESHVTMKDNRPDWVYNLVYNAHDLMLPDDWRHATIEHALEFIAGNKDDSNEFADQNTDVYTGKLLTWLSSNLTRVGYCNDAIAELGTSNPDIISLIKLGQFAESVEVFDLVIASLEDELENRENVS